MRQIVRIIAILLLLAFGIAGWMRERYVPKGRVKAPTTRYHGYELNRIAIRNAKAFTVLISNEGFGGVGRGTGVLIDATHVLTCAHMVEEQDDDLWVFPYPGGVVVKGRPVFRDKKDDLAVLELNKAVSLKHYAVFQEMHYDGQPLTVVGNTMGSMKWFVSFGIVGGDFKGYILTDAVLYGGNSGGPWVNEHGEVIALTDFTFLNRDGTRSGVHGGVAAKAIHAFLKRWKAPSIVETLRMILGGDK